MMDTVLNLGLNDQTVAGARRRRPSNERFAWDCYRRFVQMYGDVVLGVQKRARTKTTSRSKIVIDELKHERYHKDIEDTEADRRRPQGTGRPLQGARSRSAPARTSRRTRGAAVGRHRRRVRLVDERPRHRLSPQVRHPHEWGTAVNVQAMVFGNMGDDSGTGVAFTRDPATGEKEFYGEYLINAQGEDVVAGVRTPEPIAAAARTTCPTAYKELDDIRKTLEKHFNDVQDIEFTIQDGKLCMLQTRNGKRTGLAARQVLAVDMVKERLIDRKTRHHAQSRPTSSTSCCSRSSTAKAEKAAKVHRQGHDRRPRRGLRQDRISTPTDAVAARREGREGAARPRSRPRPKTCAA